MVGDVCSVEWLGETLMLSSRMTDNDDISSGDVLLLDCRPPADYQTEHITGAVHLAVPTLMLRRLATGSLPVSSVVSCLQVYSHLVIIFIHLSDTKTIVLQVVVLFSVGLTVMVIVTCVSDKIMLTSYVTV